MAQPEIPTAFFTPSTLSAGKGPVELRVFRSDLRDGTVLRWNGAPRPTKSESGGALIVSLTADDLAQPGLAEVTAYNTATDTPVPNPMHIAVGYEIVPQGTAYDVKRKRLYIATPEKSGDDRFPPNSVVALDPETNALGPIAAQNAALGPLVLSHDASALYLIVNGAGVIRRLDPERLTTVSEFRLRAAAPNAYGYIAAGIAVMPGKPETVAVAYHPDIGSSLAKLAIFDNGVKRKNEIGIYDGYDSALWSPDGKYVFLGSFANFNSPQTVLRYTVDASGVLEQTPVTAAGGGPVTVLNGVLYTNRGTMIRVDTMEPAGNLAMPGALAVDESNGRILVVNTIGLNGGSYPEYLQAFDLATQQPLGWHRIGAEYYFGANSDPNKRLYRFGDDGLIYRSTTHLLVFRTPVAGPAPATSERAIIHGATLARGPIAAGEILSIYGSNLGPDVPAVFAAEGNRIPARLANVDVWFDQRPGIVLMASKNQINVIAPLGLEPGRTVRMQVWRFGIPSAKVLLEVAQAAPGLFTRDGSGGGPVSVVNQDGGVNTASPPGSVVTLFGTGAGAPSGSRDGYLAWRAQSLAGSIRVFIGGEEAKVYYAGAAPGMPHGVFQLNVAVPQSAAKGMAPIRVDVNGTESAKGATLEIR